MQNGNWVYGGELAYTPGHISFDTLVPEPTYLSRMVDVKGRVCYAAGSLPWDGSLGWSTGQRYFIAPQVTNEPVRTSGPAQGLAVDMLVGQELVDRRMDIDTGDIGGFPILSHEHRVRIIGLRVGFKF